MAAKRRSLEDRFWSHVKKGKPDDCWEWTAGKNSDGYGYIGVEGKMVRAHRLSWEIHNGPIPEGMQILHYCDNPGCVNPFHLFLGSNADNVRDKTEKGRQSHQYGEENGYAKLTEQNIHEIRNLLTVGYPQAEIAREYEVSQTTICSINTGECWAWLK